MSTQVLGSYSFVNTPDVELSNPGTIAGVNFLQQLGLIGTGRATEILANQAPPS